MLKIQTELCSSYIHLSIYTNKQQKHHINSEITFNTILPTLVLSYWAHIAETHQTKIQTIHNFFHNRVCRQTKIPNTKITFIINFENSVFFFFNPKTNFFLASLSTTNHYRSKSSSIPQTGRASTAPANHHIQPNTITNQLHNSVITNDTLPKKLSPSNLTIPLRKTFRPAKHQRPQSAIVMGNFDPMTASTIIFNEPHKTKGLDRKTGGSK